MKIRHLELLRDLRERGTLGAVAAATFRTPSALSQQLKSAERDLGLPLVEPASRGLRLTWAGTILADGADDVLAALARVGAQLDAGRGAPAGVVSIGTLPSAGAALLPGLFTLLDGGLLTLRVDDFDLAEADFAPRTLDHDLVVAHSLSADVPAGASHLFTRVVAREPLDVAVPAGHPLAGRAALTPWDVAGERWITVPPGFPFATVHQAIEHATGAALNRVVTILDNRLVESLVGQGVGIGLLPRFSTPESARYRLIPLTGVMATRAIVVMGRPDRVERFAVRAVVDLLAQVGHQLSATHGEPAGP